jgi:N-acetylglutamate synthase-like GNAT family acetyltransferase
MIRYALKKESEDLINFLVDVNGEKNDKLAREYVTCCFSEDYRKPSFIVYEENQKVIGAAAYSQEFFTTGTWGISWVCVDEDHRNNGYGEEMVNFCLKEIQKRIDSEAFVILGTYPNKTGLYDKTGFQEVLDDHDHGSFMMKKIKPL